MYDVIVFTISAFILLTIGFFIGVSAQGHNHGKLITQCESTLPRNQNCTLIAVPEETP